MRVLILNQFFYPDISATSQLMTDLAEDLVAAGIDVTALACDKPYIGDGQLAAREDYKGVKIVRVPTAKHVRGSIIKRLISYASFYWSSFFKLLSLPKQDVVLVLTTPPLISLVPLVVRIFKGGKVIHLVQDVYPQVAIEMGVFKRGSFVARLADWFARRALHASDAIIVLGECMRGCIESAGVKPVKLHTIQNWAEESITPVPREANSFRASQPWGSKFVVLYSGNIGAAHDFTAIKEGALLLAEDKEIQFVFIGSGPRRQELEEFAAANPHANITFLNYLPRNELAQSLSAGDVHLIAQADNMTGLIIPSKLYGILAAGRPIVFTGPAQTEVARTIMDAGCGFVVSNDDPKFFADRIRALKSDRASAEEMGKRGRDLYLRKYQRKEATARYLRLLHTVHGK